MWKRITIGILLYVAANHLFDGGPFDLLVSVYAQSTTVTGTVKDTNGIAYGGASIKAQLVTTAGSPVSGQPTVTINNQAQCVSGGFGSAPCQVPFQGTVGPFGLSSTGTFTVNLQDNTQVTPAATQWLFTINSTGSPPPLGTGPQVCTSQVTISGASQTVNLSSCPALSNVTGGASPSSALPQQATLLGDYRFLATENPCAAVDYSGQGNNAVGCAGTSPTIIAGTTGGVNFVGTGAIKLPAALLPGKTWLFYADTTTSTGAGCEPPYPGLMAGNGNGAAGNAALIVDCNNSTTGIGTLISQTSAACCTQGFAQVNGIGNLTVTYAAVDHLYVNGVEIIVSAPTSSAGTMTVGNPQLGGACNGCGFGIATFGTFKLYRAIVWSTALSAADVAAANAVVQSQEAQLGLVTSYRSTATNDIILFVGDSMTAGTGVTTPFPSIVQLQNGFSSIQNLGSTGRTITGFAKGEVLENLPYLHAVPARNMEFILAGTNDIALGTTAAVAEQSMETFNIQLRSQQIFTAIGTMISRTGFDAGKNSYNTLLRQYWTTFSNRLCDIAANPSLGADGANASGTFFIGDGIHPNQNSHYNIMSPIIQACLNQTHGNRDQSTANVYSSAAAAAVATTAGSESTNTVTITTAATPANCQVGNLVTVAGVTPAGYNTTLANGFGLSGAAYIITRSATQITYYNQTTGLGAITVQGTIVCPQQQDNDIYTVLNFGAGNFTLESCQQWMGQPISIKNINAAGSTVVPLGAETIDGAANAALASNATLVLWPRLTSASAGGCNWFREQNN